MYLYLKKEKRKKEKGKRKKEKGKRKKEKYEAQDLVRSKVELILIDWIVYI
jgi:hypothetical protein